MAQRFAVLHAATIDAADPRPGRTDAPGGPGSSPRYTFESIFASGGLGAIRRAYDHRLGRTVAVKELQTYQPGSASEVRFLREAQITAQLEHPSIVPIQDLGRHESGAPYYCMKLIHGESLDALVRARPGLAARLSLVPHVLAVADALAYAHDKGIIHRDLKPANVLVGPFGETVVIDWGLAKDLKAGDDPVDSRPSAPSSGGAPADDLTRTGELVGTLPFMPLEQARGEPIDARADVYAIGAILYFVLSGAMPYEGRAGLSMLTAMLEGPPPDLAGRVPGVPADLLAIVRKAMARRPADRYASAKELAADLRRFQDGRMVSARPYSPVDVLRHFARRHRAIVGMAAASIVALTGVGAYSYAQVVEQRREADDRRIEAVTAREAEAGARAAAEAQALAARRAATRLLVEAGSEELFARQRPQQAAVLLAEAYRSDPDDVEVRTMLAEAMRGVDARRQTFAGHTGGVTKLAHDGSGGTLLARTGEGQVHLWDTRRGDRIAAIAVADDKIVDAVFADGDDELLTYTWGGELGRWSVADGRALGKIVADPVKSPRPDHGTDLHAFGPGAAMLSPGTDVRIVDVARGVELGRRGLSSPEGGRIMALGGQPREFALLDDQLTWGDAWRFRIVHWDLRRGRVHTSPELLRQDWLGIVASRDARRVAFVRPDGESSIWDVDAGAVVPLGSCGPFAERSDDGAGTMAFDAGGRQLVRLVGDDQVARWDVETRACVRVSAPLGSDTERLQITPDGRQIVLVHAGAEVSLLDVETLSPRLRLLAHTQPIGALAVAPDSATFATGSVDGEVRVWAIDDPRVLHRVAVGNVASDAEDDGQLFALGSRHDGRKTEFSIMDQFKPGAVEPGGARDLLRLDAGSGAEAAPASTSIAVAARAERLIRVGGPILVARSAWGRSVELWSASDGESLGVLDFFAVDGSSADRLALSADARQLWASASKGGGDGSVARYGLPELRLEHRSAVPGLWALAPETARGVSSSDPGREPAWGSAYLFDLESGALVATVEGTSGNFSPAGDRLFMGHHDGAIRAYDAISGKLLATLRTPDVARFARMSYGHQVASFSPDGALFASSRLDGTIDLWRAGSLEWVREFRGHSSLVRRLQFSPDGERLLSHGSQVADGDTMAFLWRLDGEGGGVRLDVPDVSEARFSPDGRLLVTGSGDGVARVWHVASGRLVAELRGHAARITALEFSPAGDRLITAADDDSAIVWQVPLERRTPAQIDEILADRAPFRLVDGQVTRR